MWGRCDDKLNVILPDAPSDKLVPDVEKNNTDWRERPRDLPFGCDRNKFIRKTLHSCTGLERGVSAEMGVPDFVSSFTQRENKGGRIGGRGV